MDFETYEGLDDLPWYVDYQESEYGIDNYERHNFLYQILFRDDQEIDPTSSENVKKQTEELIKRYCYFYENAAVILGQIVSEFTADEYQLMRRLANSINLVLNDDNKPLMEERNIDFLTLVEEAFLGEKPLEETRFYKIMEKINNDPELFKESKKVFGRDVDLINDHNMRVLIEMIYFLIGAQKYVSLREEIDEDRYFPIFDENDRLSFLTNFDCMEKQLVLSKYLEILFYQNKEDGRWSGCSSRTRFSTDEVSLIQFIRFSLVGYNLFTGAFCDVRLFYNSEELTMNKDVIPLDLLQKVHYKYHDEFPWNMEVECHSDDTFVRPRNTTSCGNKIKINEDALFTIKDKAYQICPKCGYITMVPNVKKNIFDRIKKRCDEEDNYLHKKKLVSELIALGGEAKVKRK